MELRDRYVGCLIGTAVGDSLLLPTEGLPRSTIARRFPGPPLQRLVLGRGMVSDDTEHAFLTAQAMLAAGDDAEVFAHALAFRLRWWLLTLPGGCGKATGMGLIRSWLGIHPSRSGVHSAGNGPAMRAAVIGLRWSRDPDRIRAFVTASTVLTHRDPQALLMALAVATAASHIATSGPPETLWNAWRELSDDKRWRDLLVKLERRHASSDPVDAVADDLGCPSRVTAYACTSVPLALYAWLRHRDDATACMQAIQRCGGDTDTMGAIAGALIGTDRGEGAFPGQWVERLIEWPLSPTRLRTCGAALATPGARPITWWWPVLPFRNLIFMAVILAHGLRRLLP